jgi:outer membrane protein
MKLVLATFMALSAGLANTAAAFEPGDWLVRVGASVVNPKDKNNPVVKVESSTSATINLTYMMTDIWAVEVLAAYPFKHDIKLLDGTKVGSTRHLPPTVTLQYHFVPRATFQPYVGVGLNYTTFFSEKTRGPLSGSDLSLDSSWGFAWQAGFDYMMGDAWFFNLDARYIDIGTKAKLDGASLGKVKIDPWVYGAHIGFRF